MPDPFATDQVSRPDASRQGPSVVVIGGGLAGIAAAVRLSNQGVAVTLVETRKRLGGRATSFVDPTSGRLLDNCQHVLMGCCTNLIDLYRRLGVAGRIQWHRRLYFSDDRGRVDVLEADDLPAPLHMTRSLMSFKLFSVLEKLAISRGMLAILRLGRTGRDRLHHRSFAQWLAEHRQPAGVIRKFWSVIVVSALNEQIDRVDAAYAIQVFQDGFLAHENAYVVGLPAVPLTCLYDPAVGVIENAGGRVCLATAAEAFVLEGSRVAALRLKDGRQLTADAFISALPHDRLARLCPPSARIADERLRDLERFTVSPIMGVHLWFDTPQDRPPMRLPHLILTRGLLHWIFNKGYDRRLGGWHLHGVVSAAHDWVNAPAEKIIDTAVDQVSRVLGASFGGVSVPLLHGRVIKEKRATFSACPGVDQLRPNTRGVIDNLFVAGDWCQTGWPATMEGATRSGYLAAAACAEDLGVAAPPDGGCGGSLVPDLPAAALYRFSNRRS